MDAIFILFFQLLTKRQIKDMNYHDLHIAFN